MKPGPVFILTFLLQLYRCPSSDLKGRHGLVGLPQRRQTSPSSCAARDIFTLMEYAQHISSVAVTHRAGCSHRHVVSPGKMSRMFSDGGVNAAHWLHHAEVVKTDIFHWQQQLKRVAVTKQILSNDNSRSLLELLKLATSFQHRGTTMQVRQQAKCCSS